RRRRRRRRIVPAGLQAPLREAPRPLREGWQFPSQASQASSAPSRRDEARLRSKAEMNRDSDNFRPGRRAPRAVLAILIVSLTCFAAFAPSAFGSINIESFTTSSSDTQAGGHPDLSTSFSLEAPGTPEAARNVIFEAPRGVFGNPEAIARCTSVDFAL